MATGKQLTAYRQKSEQNWSKDDSSWIDVSCK